MSGDAKVTPTGDAEDLTERLLRAAGPRPAPDEQLARQVKIAVHDSWRAAMLVRSRRRIRGRRWALAAAATAVVVVAVLVRWQTDDSLGPAVTGRAARPLARVELASGSAWIRPPAPGGQARPAVTHGAVGRGWLTETAGDGHLTLRLQGGAQVRLDVGTVVRWISPAAIFLERGGVYVDSGDGESAPAMTVRTPQGLAQELGTRFEVRFEEGRTVLRVREGGVAFATAGARQIARGGDELTWDPAEALRHRRIPLSGEAWSWVLDAAPPFALEGSTLEPFLAWVSRETGWEIRFAEEERRRSLAAATLHGSLLGVRPDEAPATVLPALGLRPRVEDGALIVEAR